MMGIPETVGNRWREREREKGKEILHARAFLDLFSLPRRNNLHYFNNLPSKSSSKECYSERAHNSVCYSLPHNVTIATNHKAHVHVFLTTFLVYIFDFFHVYFINKII